MSIDITRAPIDNLFKLLINGLSKHNAYLTIFEPIHIIVPNLSIANWLKDQISIELSICANIKFFTLNDFIHQTYLTNFSHKSQNQINSKMIKFIIYDYLCNIEYLNNTSNDCILINYLIINNQISHSKAFNLASELEIIFDEYIYLRTADCLDQKNSLLFKQLPNWQHNIWQHVISHQYFKDNYSFLDIFTKINNSSVKINVPQYTYIYALNNIYPAQLAILQKLANYTHVLWYQNLIAYEYYGDLLSTYSKSRLTKKILKEPQLSINDLYLLDGNLLLANLGIQSREFTELLLANNINIDNIDNGSSCDEDKAIEEEAFYSLLDLIKHDIRYLIKREVANKAVIDNDSDDSIKIFNCNHQAQEIKTLFNYICHLIDKHQLTLDEIVIVAPDIDKYKYTIESVFNNEYTLDANNCQIKLPFIITGNAKVFDFSIVKTLQKMLNLKFELPVNSLIDILYLSDIMQNLELSNNDILLLIKYLHDNNIYVGINEYVIKHNNEAIVDNVSLKRFFINLILGICIPNQIYYDNGKLPIYNHHYASCSTDSNIDDINIINKYIVYDNVEYVHIKLINKLIKLIDFIDSVRKLVYQEHNQLALTLLSEFIAMVDLFKNQFIINEQQIDILNDFICYLKQINIIHKIDLNILNDIIAEYFQTFNSQVIFSNKLTFTSMQSIKNIPYKAYCVIGMNFGQFPKLNYCNKLNILNNNWVIADRNINLEDKQLFLELILATKEFLYISYIGYNELNQTCLYPATPVTLLMEVIKDSIYTNDYEKHEYCKYNNPNNLYTFSYLKAITPQFNKSYKNLHWEFNDFNLSNISNSAKDLYLHQLEIKNNDGRKSVDQIHILNNRGVDLISNNIINFNSFAHLYKSFLYSNYSLYKTLNINTWQNPNMIFDDMDLSFLSQKIIKEFYAEIKQIEHNITKSQHNNLNNKKIPLKNYSLDIYDYLVNKFIIFYQHIGEAQFKLLFDYYMNYQQQLLTMQISNIFNYDDCNVCINSDGSLILMNDFIKYYKSIDTNELHQYSHSYDDKNNYKHSNKVGENNLINGNDSDKKKLPCSYSMQIKGMLLLLFIKNDITIDDQLTSLMLKGTNQIILHDNCYNSYALSFVDTVNHQEMLNELLEFYDYSMNNPILINYKLITDYKIINSHKTLHTLQHQYDSEIVQVNGYKKSYDSIFYKNMQEFCKNDDNIQFSIVKINSLLKQLQITSI